MIKSYTFYFVNIYNFFNATEFHYPKIELYFHSLEIKDIQSRLISMKNKANNESNKE